MAHPYKHQAHSSNKAKAHSMGKVNNLDIPIMRAVGENRSGGVHESSASMQHMKQAAASGMKRGGHAKHKKAMVAVAAPAIPPSADPAAMAAAGAGSSPAPAPMGGGMPGQPPMKRGGAVRNGGKSYPLDAGSRSGEGRLEKAHMPKPPFKPIKGRGE
jgi:hypothetical protein